MRTTAANVTVQYRLQHILGFRLLVAFYAHLVTTNQPWLSHLNTGYFCLISMLVKKCYSVNYTGIATHNELQLVQIGWHPSFVLYCPTFESLSLSGYDKERLQVLVPCWLQTWNHTFSHSKIYKGMLKNVWIKVDQLDDTYFIMSIYCSTCFGC